ncbi:uncharacterized protein Z520_10369 [Fonsecaea multimorphosa CBS 102226]|uniref:Uncharacterized protein n=1 Tax=Fonsecaea multimorphosa CBS 102226 TaxID=1442371 RepID=A0A0D2JL81_9EURO|nr:uncharacterized protein Z520_10369 [Fonsecaea multimorphosa CBS 102226]KIX94032.1 hypothetical protein Z520_10369 [Fonsecaea multimorphosa CBS 102226]OAL19378.1 hypothetical protein AYO22_09922 [Fonsecaea multimorphosa]
MASLTNPDEPQGSSKSPDLANKRTRNNSTPSQSPSKKPRSSPIDTCATNADAATTVTHFGIELEFVLAFKEDLLKSIIAKYHLDAHIIKTLADYEHRSLLEHDNIDTNPSYNCRWRYPSWALHVPETDMACTSRLHKGMFFNKVDKGKQWVRRYVAEPLLVAQDRLDRQGLHSNVVGWLEPDPHNRDSHEASKIPLTAQNSTDERVVLRKSLIDYTEWTLTNDHTVIGALRSQLREHLVAQGVTEDDISKWDSYGMELISPVFDLARKTEAFSQVGTYLGALFSKETSTLESIWASTHVHVGFNFSNPEDMPLLLLQHLAYILVLHEDLLSKCHPRSRCGIRLLEPTSEKVEVEDTYDDEEFDPDAPYEPPPEPSEEELEEDNERGVLAFEAKYTGADNVSSNARYLRKQLLWRGIQYSTETIRDAIFQQRGNIFDLVDLLQQRDEHDNPYRGYMYNFANLVNLARNRTSWKQIKPTVEFRQHACTLDADVLNRWVTLLERIVRVAETNAQRTMLSDPTNPTEGPMESSFAEMQGNKYPSNSTAGTQWPCESMSDFCVGFLGMDSEEGEYWQQRFERYKDDRPEEGDDE